MESKQPLICVETLVLDDLTEFVYNLDPHSFSGENKVSTEASSPSYSFENVSREEEPASSNEQKEKDVNMLSSYSDDGLGNDMESNKKKEEEEDVLENDLVSIGLEEEPVSMGVAAALKHLQMTGNLHRDVDQVGRTKDERIADARKQAQGKK